MVGARTHSRRDAGAVPCRALGEARAWSLTPLDVFRRLAEGGTTGVRLVSGWRPLGTLLKHRRGASCSPLSGMPTPPSFPTISGHLLRAALIAHLPLLGNIL